MLSSRIDSILRSTFELGEPIRVTGSSSTSRALIVARYIQEYKKKNQGPLPVILICQDEDRAAELAQNIECLGSVIDHAEITTLQFPSWEHSPYSPIALSLRTRIERIASLTRILNNKPPDLIITTLIASVQKTLNKVFFQQISIPLRADASVESREALISHLLQAGYLRNNTVEDPGTFAVRGDLLDVFPVDRLKPIRIELFGDVIERMREFDTKSQRALSEESSLLGELIVPPAREVLIHSSNASLVREKLKRLADDSGVPKKIRDPVLHSVHEGIYPDYSDAWAPFAYEDPQTLWDYLPNQAPILWEDEYGSIAEMENFLGAQKKKFQESLESARILPPPEDLYLWNFDQKMDLSRKTKLFLDRIEIGGTPTSISESSQPAPELSSRHQVVVLNHSGLSQGNRHSLAELENHFQTWRKQGFKIVTVASTQSQVERIRFLLEERRIPCIEQGPPVSGQVSLSVGNLTEGFQWTAEGLIILTESEILGSKHASAHQKRRKTPPTSTEGEESTGTSWSEIHTLSDLGPGDAVVHVDHGIGRYQGIVRLDLTGAPADFLMIEYANRDKLYLPIYRLTLIQKYIGAGSEAPLDRLGSQQFAKTKEKVRSSIQKLAIDLVQLYAERKIQQGICFSPRDAAFREFEAQFPFDETPDQLKAINQTLKDLESGRVMDRLICGDVGYGKTEVGIRAAFKAVSDGKQVAVLVPTTILAQQHEQSFKARLKNYPLLIESISRFKTQKEQKVILEALAGGKIDIIIGTHRLLSKDVQFNDLGLVIVDEEHRFGVEHKEKLKTLKLNTHVLTLTATPIPRTLHMALSGLRDISIMNTPPVDRLPIRTFISKMDDDLIQKAIQFELARGGQVFFLHNRVQTLGKIAQHIKELVPQANVVTAHGQMNENELEQAMLTFYEKKANVLLCTTIIESGLDIPSANTIIIDRADTLGLAQLYQIRGRVGRGQERAYAYLVIPSEGSLNEDAKRRLEVIQKFVELGSGFQIASHDLEIRGGGDLLGPQQSGNIAAVGFDLYTELLEEAIQEIQGNPRHAEEKRKEPEIKTPFPAYLSEEYVPDTHHRLSLYRRFSAAQKDQEVDALEEELRDRFGPLPNEAQNLMWLIRIKITLKKIGIEALTAGTNVVSLLPGPNSLLDPARAIALVSAYPQIYQLKPDSKLTAKVSTASLRDLFFGLEKLFREFSPATPQKLG